MTTRIQLDLQAVNALFPEGSEQRVELTRAVASSLLKQLAIKDVKFSEESLAVAVRDAVKNALRTSGFMSDHWKCELPLDFRRQINEHVKSAVSLAIRDGVDQAVEGGKVDIRDRAQEHFDRIMRGESNSLLRDWVKRAVKDELGSLKLTVGSIS